MKKIHLIFTSIFFLFIFKVNASSLNEHNPALYLEDINSSVHTSLGGMGFADDAGQMYYNSSVLYDSIKGRNFTFSYLTTPTSLSEHSFFLGRVKN